MSTAQSSRIYSSHYVKGLSNPSVSYWITYFIDGLLNCSQLNFHLVFFFTEIFNFLGCLFFRVFYLPQTPGKFLQFSSKDPPLKSKFRGLSNRDDDGDKRVSNLHIYNVEKTVLLHTARAFIIFYTFWHFVAVLVQSKGSLRFDDGSVNDNDRN